MKRSAFAVVLLCVLVSLTSAIAQTVSTTTLNISPASPGSGAVVTMTAIVSPANTPGVIRFKDGSNVLATLALANGSATFKTSGLVSGVHTITAEFPGTSTVSPSASSPYTLTVGAAPTTTGLTITGNNPVGLGAASQFTAKVLTYAAGSISGTVDLSDSSTKLTSATLAAMVNSFTAASGLTTGGNPYFLKAADLNGDGIVDLVTTSGLADRVEVYLGRGDGTFAARVSYAAGSTIRGIAIGDFNQDGKPDIAVANYLKPGKFTILRGVGDGTFIGATTYALGGNNPWDLEAADLNNDGILDLVSADFGATGTGNNVTVLLGQGNGTFVSNTNATTLRGPKYLAIGDFDGDNIPDLVAADYTANSLSVLHGNGDGTFATQVAYVTDTNPEVVITGDFNGDGRIDLAVSEYGSTTLSIFINNGSGFASRVNYTTGYRPYGITAADLNGDGYLDLAVTNRGTDGVPSTVSIFYGKGDGTFQSKVDFGTGAGPVAIIAADLNGGGRPDLAVANYDDGSVTVLLGYATADASLSYAGLPAGAQSLTATYVGNDGILSGSTSSAVVQNVTQGASVVSLTGNAITYGQDAVIKATVVRDASVSNFAPAPSGTVTLSEAGTVIASSTIDVDGAVTFNVKRLTAGDHTFTAAYEGDVSYLSATASPIVISVAKAELTVTANNKSRMYGSVNPVLDGIIAGAVADDGLTATFTTSAVNGSAVGDYAIVPAFDVNPALANYNVHVMNGTLAVTPAPLSIVANSKTRPYGSANPLFDGTVTGLVNGDAISAAYTNTSTEGTGVGTYDIIPAPVDADGKLSNYTVTLTKGALTITPVPLTITANDKLRAYNTPDPVFDGAVTGLVNGDVLGITYSTTANATSPVGTYPITATSADPKASNYVITVNAGTLTIMSQGVDLIEQLVSAPLSGNAGGSITVSDTARNQGILGTTNTFATYFYISTDGITKKSVIGSRLMTGLVSGGTNTASTTVTLPTNIAGKYYIIACSDAMANVTESVESNNCSSSAALSINGADLVVSSVTAPATAPAGGSFTVTDTTANLAGGGAAPASYTYFYLSTDGVAKGTTLGSQYVGSLAAGADSGSVTTTLSAPPNIKGTYYVIACADATKAVAESNENNNCVVSASFTVVAADLTVSAASAPDTVVLGATFGITDTTTAQTGGGNAGASYTGFYLSTDGVTRKLSLGSRLVPALASGASSGPVTTNVVMPSTTAKGTYYVLVCADSSSAITESNETNNCKATASITVQ